MTEYSNPSSAPPSSCGSTACDVSLGKRTWPTHAATAARSLTPSVSAPARTPARWQRERETTHTTYKCACARRRGAGRSARGARESLCFCSGPTVSTIPAEAGRGLSAGRRLARLRHLPVSPCTAPALPCTRNHQSLNSPTLNNLDQRHSQLGSAWRWGGVGVVTIARRQGARIGFRQ